MLHVWGAPTPVIELGEYAKLSFYLEKKNVFLLHLKRMRLCALTDVFDDLTIYA